MAISLHNIAPAPGANVRKKRVGRGHGSGRHKTSGRGTKGQKARTGHHGLPKPGFEGGQTAMARRLPKRGFNSFSRREVSIVNVISLAQFSPGATVDPDALRSARLVPSSAKRIKILGHLYSKEMPSLNGMTVRAHEFSQSAKELLARVGCTVEVIVDPVNAQGTK